MPSYVPLNISTELDSIIRECMPTQHPLDEDVVFDPIEFLDRKFSDGVTPEALHDYADTLRQELRELDNSRSLSFTEVTLACAEGDVHAHAARRSISDLRDQLSSIHERVIASEQSMRRASDDLISLNLARKNVSYTITLLKKIVMAVGACDQLVELARTREYRQISPLVQSMKHLSRDAFMEHREMEQVDELVRHMDRIFKELGDQAKDDFLDFAAGTDFEGAAETAESLGIESELTNQYCSRVLRSYEEEFSPFEGESVSSSFPEHEKRFQWLSKALSELKDKSGKIFPTNWLVSGHLCMQFCQATRRHFVQMLEDSVAESSPVIPQIVLKCIDLENDLQRRFDKLAQADPADRRLQYSGVISKCFGKYMAQVWVPEQERVLVERMRANKNSKIVESVDNNPPILYESAIQLMKELRQCVKDARRFRLDDVIIPSLGRVIGRILVAYGEFFLKPIFTTSKKTGSPAVLVGTCDYLIEAAAHLGVPVGPLEEIIVLRNLGIGSSRNPSPNLSGGRLK